LPPNSNSKMFSCRVGQLVVPSTRLKALFVVRYPRTSGFQAYRAGSILPPRRKMSSGPTTHPSLTLVSTERAPAAIGPYSQGVKVGDLLFVSGSIALDPKTGQVVSGGVMPQTELSLQNMKAIIEAGGSELGKVIKTTVFLKSMDDFSTVNTIYEKFFGSHKPARSAVEVARLPKDVLFEIECIASLKE